ncbi:MAG: hypothetical protein ACYTFG_19815 [Planctomycetota bacterium]|jgi:uncharacterized protein YrzB (UPF0473 family)
MVKIYYATCPQCGAYSALQGKEMKGGTLVCIDCDNEFPFVKEILKTLDEIVDESDGRRPPPTA